MKQKLLLFILPLLFLTTLAIAQDRSWDIGTTSASWPNNMPAVTAGSPNLDVDGLTIVAGSSDFGGIRAANYTFSDSYMAEQEWTSNGSSSGNGILPTRRYFTFPVSGPSTIKVYFRVNGTGGRKAQISDGANLLGEATSEDSSEPIILTATYNDSGAATIYVYSSASINYHRITVTDGILGIDDSQSVVSTNIKSVGNRIYVSNVKTSTEVNIYSITGALIKSFKTNTDTDFSLKSGLWIASLKTTEGQKAVKLLTY